VTVLLSLALFAHAEPALPSCASLTAPQPIAETSRATPQRPAGTLQHTASMWLGLWTGFVGRADGATCTLAPSCSAYTATAIRTLGPVPGIFHAMARMTRSHAPTDRPRCLGRDGRVRAYDPLEAHLP
jgi:putative component of membrane protein insertase Oxa1/YidC/SpoIIIJ protein YidD